MTTIERRVIERDIRRTILTVEDRATQDALFALLGLIHELAVAQENAPGS
jgi:hypothetical protein